AIGTNHGTSSSSPSRALRAAKSALERAREVAKANETRKFRESRLVEEGDAAVRTEALVVFQSIEQEVAQINADTRELEIRAGWRQDHCVVRVGKVTLSLYPDVTGPVSECRMVARLWFGGIVL